MSKFAHCHPDLETGLMWCQHHNGSWIAFPASKKSTEKTSEDVNSEEETEEV